MPPLAPSYLHMSGGRILVLGTFLICLAMGVACGNDATPTLPPSPTTMPTASPEAYKVTITSSDGEEVVLTQPPMRIVSYDSAAVEILFAIGEGERLVATHDFVAYPPEAVDLPKVGASFTINLEEIVALEPDLIYTFYGSSADDLKRADVPVIYLETPTTLEGIVGQMRMWGRIADNEAAADQLIRRFEAKLEELQGLLASVEEGPTLFHDDSLFYSRGPNTLVGKVYEMLKVKNIAFDIPDGGYGQLSSEVVVERNPGVIITTFPERTQEILSDPALRDTSAVKEGRVYTANADLISIAGPRFVEAIEEIARYIHPGLFE